MTLRLSELFGKEIFTSKSEHKGKIFDLVINLEKGRIETITTESLKVKSKQEARKIISEKSIPYRKVMYVKDIVLVRGDSEVVEPEEEPAPQKPITPSASYRLRHRR